MISAATIQTSRSVRGPSSANEDQRELLGYAAAEVDGHAAREHVDADIKNAALSAVQLDNDMRTKIVLHHGDILQGVRGYNMDAFADWLNHSKGSRPRSWSPRQGHPQ